MAIDKNSPEVIAYRVQRMRNAPRNWVYFIAACTVINGLLIGGKGDVSFPIAMAFPFLFPGDVAHYIAAAVLIGVGQFEAKEGVGPQLALAAYFLDTLWAAYAEQWLAVGLHVAVFAFVAIALNGARLLERQQVNEIGQ